MNHDVAYLPIIARVHSASLLHTVEMQVVGQRGDSVRIPLARVHVGCTRVHKIRKSKVTDPCKNGEEISVSHFFGTIKE